MARHFRGEADFQYHYSVKWKDLSPKKRAAVLSCVVFGLFFLGILMLTSRYLIGAAGLTAVIFWYLPLVTVYVAKLKGRQRMVPALMAVIGLAGEAGLFLGAAYLVRHGVTPVFLVLLCGIPLVLGFSISGACLFAAGMRRKKKWKTYSKPILATVVDYKVSVSGVLTPDEIRTGIYGTRGKARILSPILRYTVGNETYEGETESYFGENQVPQVGEQMEIHVNPVRPEEFLLELQRGGMLTGLGILLLVMGLVILMGAGILLAAF